MEKKDLKKNVLTFWKRNKKNIYYSIIGACIGAIITISFYPDRIAVLADGTQVIATTKNGTITADNLYSNMKQLYAIDTLLNEVDEQILNELYTLTDDMKQEIEDEMEYYFNIYEMYGYSKEEFLTGNGFENEEEFEEYLKLSYLRNIYYEEYIIEQISEKDIENYYNNNVFGDIETKYISIDEDENNETIIEEILEKLKKGTTYDEIVEEYGDSISYEDLEYQSWNGSLDATYLETLINLENNQYTQEYVSTDYGYTIVFRGDQKEKLSLE